MNIQPWRGGYRTTVCIPNTGPKFFANYIFLEPKFHSSLFILYSPLQSFSLSSYNSTFSTFFPLTYPKLDTYVTIGQLSKVSSFFFFCYCYVLDARVSERGKNWVTTFSRISASFFFSFFLASLRAFKRTFKDIIRAIWDKSSRSIEINL